MISNSSIKNTKNNSNGEDDVIKKKVTKKDIEICDVAMLDSNIEPHSKPSGLFERLEEKRRIRHENALRKLAENLHQVNLNTEKNISLSSLELKAHMKVFDDWLKEILQSIDKPEVLSYCTTVFVEYQNQANNYKLQHQQLVNELHEDLNKFENIRSKEYEKLLHVACEEIRKIGYFLPYEVQIFIENETLKMNKLSLNNRRCYDDLKLTLTLITEQMLKSFTDNLQCIQEKWTEKKALEFSAQSKLEKKIVNTPFEDSTRFELKGFELHTELSPDDLYSICKVDEYFKNVRENLEVLKSFTLNMNDLYKRTVNVVYCGFDNEIGDLKKELSSVEPLIIEQREIKPLLFEGSFDQTREAENVETYWQETIIDVKSQLKEYSEFLKDVSVLWDRHTERVCESKKLILRALEKADENNQTSLQEIETKLNIGLDTLRQEFNRNKLENAYSSAVGILDSIKKKYEFNYVSDVSTIEDFHKMMVLEADVFSAEIKEFVYVTHGQLSDNTRMFSHFCDHYRCLHDAVPIAKEIQLFSYKVKHLKYWKQGLCTALEVFSQKAREFFKHHAESWVEKKIEILSEKMAVQIDLIEKRMERVRLEIYEKRLAEVEFHQRVFDEHKQAIKAMFQQMSLDLENLAKERQAEVTLIKESFRDIEINALNENRSEVIRSNQIMLERKKLEIESKLKSFFEKFRAYCDAKMIHLRQSTNDFMKDIKLFHEYGNYSAEEARMFVNLLESVDKEIITEIKIILKDSLKEENDILKTFNSYFTPTMLLLNSLYEETHFYKKIQEKLSDFLDQIRELAEVLNSDFQLLKKHTNCFCQFLRNREKPLKEDDHKFWLFLLDLLYRNVSNLFYPVRLSESSVYGEQLEEELEEIEEEEDLCACRCMELAKLSTKATASKTLTFRTTELDENFNCKDFRKELFNGEEPPENNGVFMAVITNALWIEMDSLQKIACNFYKKLHERKILRGDLIPPNYEVFAEKIITKLKFYNTQCEQLWLQIILDFLPILGSIKLASNYYLEKKINEYRTLNLFSLEKLKEDFLACLDFRSFETSRVFQDLENKLLPLHGSPQNIELLNELEEKVVRQTTKLGVEWDAAVTRFKNQLKCFRLHHIKEKTEINKIQNFHLELMDKLFVDDLGNNLLDLIMEYCNRGGFCFQRSQDERNDVEEEIPDEFQIKFPPFSSKFLSIQSYYEKLKHLIETERSIKATENYLPSLEKTSHFFSRQPCWSEDVLNLLLEPFNCEKQILECLKKLGGCLGKLKELADSQVNVHEEVLFKWLDVWKFNVKKVQNLYRVKCDEKTEESEKLLVGTIENNKTKSEKTSASVSSTLPRLCPTTKSDLKDISCNIPKLKSRLLRNRPVSNANEKRSILLENQKTNLHKSGLESNDSLLHVSPRNYRGQIPVIHGHSLSLLRMSMPVTRSPSPIKKVLSKDYKTSNKVKTITFDDGQKKNKTCNSRSPSPIKKSTNYKNSKPKISPKQMDKSASAQRSDNSKQELITITSPRTNSPSKKKSKAKVLSSSNMDFLSSEKLERPSQNGDLDSVIIKQTSQPSLCKKEKLIQPREKISLDHLKNEVYSGDHRRLSFEKVQLCIEKTVENLSMGESKKSYLVTYSTEDAQNQEEISLAILQNLSRASITTYSTENERKPLGDASDSKGAIRTLSGQELILTPSMKLDIEKAEIGCEDIEISELLHESGENFDDQKDAQVFQDDANEYDSEVSTDGETSKKEAFQSPKLSSTIRVIGNRKSANSLWKSREAELLNDVDYRQSVYHPTVSRRQKDDLTDMEFRPKSKSIEDNFGYANKASDRIVRSRSSTLKNRYTSQTYTTDKSNRSSKERLWATSFDKTDGKPMYNSVIQDVPFYGMKRVRTKKERVSGALLRFTLKIMRLLALFNLWPGDNCYMMTSQSLRLSR